MMDRRRFLLTSLAGVLVAPLAAEAQRAGKVYRIGYRSIQRPEIAGATDRRARTRPRDLGLCTGQNVVFEHRYADGPS